MDNNDIRLAETSKVGKKCRDNIDYAAAQYCQTDVGNAKQHISLLWTITDLEGVRITGPAINSLDSEIMSILYSMGVEADRQRKIARAAGDDVLDPRISVSDIMLRLNPKLANSNEGASALRAAVNASLSKLTSRCIIVDYTDQLRARLRRTDPAAAQRVKNAKISATLLSGDFMLIRTSTSGIAYGLLHIHPVDGSICKSLALYRYAADVGQIDVVPPALLPTPQDDAKTEKFSLPRQAIRSILQSEMITQRRIWARKKSKYKGSLLSLDRLYAAYRTDQGIARIDHPSRVRQYVDTMLKKWVKTGFLESFEYEDKVGWRYKISKSQLG